MRSLFPLYSYIWNLFYLFLEVSPPILRKLIFKIIFKRYGKSCIIDYHTYFRYPKKISIGDGTCINRGVKIYPSYYNKDAEIIIGRRVAVGPEVSLFAAGHDYRSLELPDTGGAIQIHDYAWIGARSMILSNVEIGEGAVIGLGSVVTEDIPPYCVAVGSPARVIRKRIVQEGQTSLDHEHF